jgi:hypothetical protein
LERSADKGDRGKSSKIGKELEIDKRDTEIFAYCLLERCRGRNVGIVDVVVVADDVGSC